MAKYLPICLLIGLVPLTFLAAACYTSHHAKKFPGTQQTRSTLPPLQRLSECLAPSNTRRNLRNAAHNGRPHKVPPSDDLEMQCIGVQSPPSTHLHCPAGPTLVRADTLSLSKDILPPRRSRARIPDTVAHYRAAALASLERALSSCSVTNNVDDGNDNDDNDDNMAAQEQPRPSAPSPPASSTASAEDLYPGSRQWWALVDTELGVSTAEEAAVPTCKRETAMPGRMSAFRLPAIKSGDSQGERWTEVSLQ